MWLSKDYFSEHVVIAGGLWQPTEATDVDAAAVLLVVLLLCCWCCCRAACMLLLLLAMNSMQRHVAKLENRQWQVTREKIRACCCRCCNNSQWYLKWQQHQKKYIFKHFFKNPIIEVSKNMVYFKTLCVVSKRNRNQNIFVKAMTKTTLL